VHGDRVARVRVPDLVAEVEVGAADRRHPQVDRHRLRAEDQRLQVLDLLPADDQTRGQQRAAARRALRAEREHPRVLEQAEELHVVDVPVGVHVRPAQGGEHTVSRHAAMLPHRPGGGGGRCR
jgi:hypothetical protein